MVENYVKRKKKVMLDEKNLLKVKEKKRKEKKRKEKCCIVFLKF
jgi:hypothetical protein